MRRTYKSKKDVGGSLNHKDLLSYVDAKSSVFDAFYIQNIKQATREVSSGSSCQNKGAPHRISKRKYVKRILKDASMQEETGSRRNSASGCTYLTPDKSIHVNRAPDPFDLLLKSSPTYHENSPLPPRISKNTYGRKKEKKPNKYNHSIHESIDSDKENSSTEFNQMAQSMSDIEDYKLNIEQVKIDRFKCHDESIDNIVKKIPHLTNINQNSHSNSIKRNHRVTEIKNDNYTLIMNSPLCSTPFEKKIRSKSIYNLSPILFDLDKRSEAVNTKLNSKSTVKSENDETQYNCECLQEKRPRSFINLDLNNDDSKYKEVSKLNTSKIEEYNIKDSVQNKTFDSCLFTTETEPFYGFSNVSCSKDCSKYNKTQSSETSSRENVAQNNSHVLNTSEPNIKCKQNVLNKVCEKNDGKKSIDYDSASFYKTCDSVKLSVSLDSPSTCKKYYLSPKVIIKRMNNSLFYKYYKKLNVSTNSDTNIRNNECDSHENSILKKNDNSIDLLNGSFNSKESVYEHDGNNSDQDTEQTDFDHIPELNINSEEDRCVSFVTTRRGNKQSCNSIIFIDNNSFSSSFIVNENDDVMTQRKISSSSKSDFIDDYDKTLNKSLLKRVDNTQAINNIVVGEVMENGATISSDHTTKKNRNESDTVVTKLDRDVGTDKPIVLQPGKKWERSLSIYKRMTAIADNFEHSILDDENTKYKGRRYRQSVIDTMEMQKFQGSSRSKVHKKRTKPSQRLKKPLNKKNIKDVILANTITPSTKNLFVKDNNVFLGSLHNESINGRRSTFMCKPSRSTIKIIKENTDSRVSLCSTTVYDDLEGFLSEDCDDTIVELSKLSIDDSVHEVTVLKKFHDTSRIASARDYVLRRCNQTEVILFDECYPDTELKNCHKIGEGVYGEVFLWRARDGQARVLKIIPIAGDIKVNGEPQKGFHEIISEIVIAMELSALRSPIAAIEKLFDEGKQIDALDLHSVENATDIFNEVIAVRCVSGSYPARLLDLWELYDECRGSDNDNPALLPCDQHYIVLELANAGQDLESYQFNSAEQAHALFLQVALGLAVGEEALQFEHRDLHWGNVLVAPSEARWCTGVVRGRALRVARRGVRGSLIDYSLSRLSLGGAALFTDLAHDEALFDAVGDYQFAVYRLMRERLDDDWSAYDPRTNVLWLHYLLDKMLTALRYKRTDTKVHRQHVAKLRALEGRILDYRSAAQFVLTDDEF